jgi:hypothetical protein
VSIISLLDNTAHYSKELLLLAQNLLGCTAVFLIECRPMFQRCVRAACSIPEDSELHTRRRENLKSQIIIIIIVFVALIAVESAR